MQLAVPPQLEAKVYSVAPIVRVSEFPGRPLTVMVPVPPLPPVKVSVFEFRPVVILTVWPEAGPTLDAVMVPVACAAVALVVRVNTFPLTPFVMAMVGAVVEVGEAATVPMALATVALVVRLRVAPFTTVIVLLA
jgi:hypothetical protein